MAHSLASFFSSLLQSSQFKILSNNRYRLVSYVDAQNTFGGEVRSNFVCIVEGSGENAGGYAVMRPRVFLDT